MRRLLSKAEKDCYDQLRRAISMFLPDELATIRAILSEHCTSNVIQRLLLSLVDNQASPACLELVLSQEIVTTELLHSAFTYNQQQFLVQHPLFPAENIEFIIQRPEQYKEDILFAALAHPNCPQNIFLAYEQALYEKSKDVALEHDKTLRETISAVLRSPHCPQAILSRPLYLTHFKSTIIQNPNCQLDLMEEINQAKSMLYKSELLLNPNCPQKIIQNLVEQSSSLLHLALAHPNFGPCLPQYYPKYGYLVTKNPQCPINILQDVIVQPSTSFDIECAKQYAMRNPQATVKILLFGLVCKDSLAQGYARLNRNAPRWLRQLKLD